MHPLWQTPVLPLLFLLSAISVGFPMVIFESMIASRSFKLKIEMDVLSRLGGTRRADPRRLSCVQAGRHVHPRDLRVPAGVHAR